MHYKFLLLVHCANVVPLTQEKVENFPMMLSKACFNPESEFQRVPFYNFMPLDQILFLVYSCVIICSNIYLYRCCMCIYSYRYKPLQSRYILQVPQDPDREQCCFEGDRSEEK